MIEILIGKLLTSLRVLIYVLNIYLGQMVLITTVVISLHLRGYGYRNTP